MNIKTKADLDKVLADGPFAWPGGYPIYFIADDGEALSFETVQAERDRITDSLDEKCNDGWRVIACDIKWEDSDLYCAHSGKRIESAYAEANARLIASAPALVEENEQLKSALKRYEARIAELVAERNAPDAALAEALQDMIPLAEKNQFVSVGEANAIDAARAALRSAGIED